MSYHQQNFNCELSQTTDLKQQSILMGMGIKGTTYVQQSESGEFLTSNYPMIGFNKSHTTSTSTGWIDMLLGG